MPDFIFIGERLNTHREPFQQSVATRDEKAVIKEARRQERRGATHLDFNTSADREKECDQMLWLLDTILPKIQPGTGVVIDTASPETFRRAMERLGARAGTIVNTVACEPSRVQELLAPAAQFGAGVIAASTSGGSIPQSAIERVNAARERIAALNAAGISEDRQYLDPQVLPLAHDTEQPRAILESLREIRRHWPGIHLVAGLSNISFNLANRALLNRTYLAMLLASGIDAVIANPCDKKLQQTLLASRALLGQDEFLTTYLSEIKPED